MDSAGTISICAAVSARDRSSRRLLPRSCYCSPRSSPSSLTTPPGSGGPYESPRRSGGVAFRIGGTRPRVGSICARLTVAPVAAQKLPTLVSSRTPILSGSQERTRLGLSGCGDLVTGIPDPSIAGWLIPSVYQKASLSFWRVLQFWSDRGNARDFLELLVG